VAGRLGAGDGTTGTRIRRRGGGRKVRGRHVARNSASIQANKWLMGVCGVCSAEGWSGGLPHGWVLLAAPDGTPYYYNEDTQESSWTLPSDAAQPPLPPKVLILYSPPL
jgi:hypothetical protein